MTLVIKDREGCISQRLMRHYFEQAVTQTEALAAHVPLDCAVDSGGTVEYANSTTQAIWVGWALGMRCQERLEHAQEAPNGED